MRLGFQGRYLELWCAGKCTCNYLLGVIVIILFDKLWNLLGSKGLFQQVHDPNGQHDAASHLAETIALVGHPPGHCSRNQRPCHSATGLNLSLTHW